MNNQPDHDQPRFGEFGETQPAPQPQSSKLSLLAIASLVTGILSAIGCCLPVVGIVPVGLGIGSLFAIQRSRGATAGRAMAITGLILGMLSLVLSTGLWLGASAVGGKFGPVYSQALDPDPSVVRTVLSAGLAADLTDEQITGFQDLLEAEHPGQAEIPAGLFDLWMSYGKVGGDPNKYQGIRPATEGPTMPLPAHAGDDWFYLVVLMSPEEQIGAGFPPIPAVADIGFEAANGTMIWLSEVQTPIGDHSQSPPDEPADE